MIYLVVTIAVLSVVFLGIMYLKKTTIVGALQSQIDYLSKDNLQEKDRCQTLLKENMELRENLGHAKSNIEAFRTIQGQMEKTFQALASQVLFQNSESFLQMAQQKFDHKSSEFSKLIEPIEQSLRKVETDLQSVEKIRGEQFGRLSQQLQEVSLSSEGLRQEAQSLSSALKRPGVRGSWGELQLRRVVELAGMNAYCDFEEQVHVSSNEKGLQKPDMIIHLPNQRVLIVDSK